MIDTHSLDPVKVLRAGENHGGGQGQCCVVGCEPERFDSDRRLGRGTGPERARAAGPLQRPFS